MLIYTTSANLSSTRERLMQLLRKNPMSVRELADKLNLTSNAIRSHIASLERDNLVRKAGKRKGIRKPESLYALTGRAEMLFPKVYHTVLNVMLEVIKEKLPADRLQEILNEVGRRIAATSEPPLRSGQKARLEYTLQLLGALGGYAELEETSGGKLLQGYSCPLGEVTNRHPEMCTVAKILLEKTTGMKAAILCRQNGKAQCVFRIE